MHWLLREGVTLDLQGGAILALKILGMTALAGLLSILGRTAILKSRYNAEMDKAARSLGGCPVAMRTDVPETYIVEAPSSAAPDEWSETPLWLVSKGEVTGISPEDVWSLRQEGLLRWYFDLGAEGADNTGENTVLGLARSRPGAHPSIMATYNTRQMRYAALAVVLFIALVILLALFADDFGIPRLSDVLTAALVQRGI